MLVKRFVLSIVCLIIWGSISGSGVAQSTRKLNEFGEYLLTRGVDWRIASQYQDAINSDTTRGDATTILAECRWLTIQRQLTKLNDQVRDQNKVDDDLLNRWCGLELDKMKREIGRLETAGGADKTAAQDYYYRQREVLLVLARDRAAAAPLDTLKKLFDGKIDSLKTDIRGLANQLKGAQDAQIALKGTLDSMRVALNVHVGGSWKPPSKTKK